MNALLQHHIEGEVSFKDIIQNQKSLVVFVRHPGWPVCREMLTQLRERYQELTASDYQVIVITPSTSAYLEQFVNAFGPYPFPIYGDPKRELYNNMGHLTMQKSKLLLKAAKIFVTKGSKAFFPEDADQKQLIQTAIKTHDVFIQGGTWLFDEQGNVLWNHIDTAPEDHASIDLILFKMNR